jgi:hypothetical protein
MKAGIFQSSVCAKQWTALRSGGHFREGQGTTPVRKELKGSPEKFSFVITQKL